MGLHNLEAFLKNKKEKERKEEVSWEEIKLQWMDQIDAFYDEIQTFIIHLQEKGLLSFGFEKIRIQEEHLGEYETKK